MTHWYRLVWLDDFAYLTKIRKNENTVEGRTLQILWHSFHILTHALNNLCRPYGRQLNKKIQIFTFSSIFPTTDWWGPATILCRSSHLVLLSKKIVLEIVNSNTKTLKIYAKNVTLLKNKLLHQYLKRIRLLFSKYVLRNTCYVFF